MKIKPKQYAQGFLGAVKDADEKEIKKAVKTMIEILAKNNQVSQIEKIISYFNSLWNKEKGTIEAEIISAVKLEKNTLDILSEFIKKRMGGKKAEIKEVINKNIKGGFIIRMGDEILDSSLKTRLGELKKAMLKN